jgi:hypothetical protein
MWLRIQGSDGGDDAVPITGPLVIGSDLDADLTLAGDGVAPRHISLAVEGDVVTVTDLAPGSAALVDGQPIAGSVVLEPGRELAIGPYRLSVSAFDPTAVPPPPPPPVAQTEDLGPVAAAKPRRRRLGLVLGIIGLVLLVGGGTTAVIVLTRDTTPPQTRSGTADVSTYGSVASFDFSSSEEDSTFECSLDGSDWAACESPYELQEVAAGEHALEVRATDAAGNLDTSAAEFPFAVEPLPAPEVTVARRPPHR